MANHKRNLSTKLGLLLGFLGMTGLVLTILSLLPLNVYSIYSSINALIDLVKFEHDRTEKWSFSAFSANAKLYSIFLVGVILSATLVILFTLTACVSRKRSNYNYNQEQISVEANNYKQYQQQYKYNGNSWFIRISSFTIILQLSFGLFGTHLKYVVKSDTSVIPLQVQYNTFICLAIIWINYLSMTIFLFVLFLASCFILMGAKKEQQEQQQHQQQQQNLERQPLLL